jgi:transporter family protein
MSRTGAVAAGLGPLLSSTVGVLYLGETPSGKVIAGTLLIVLGIVALSFEKSHWGRTWRFLGYPILGAVCLALTAVFRKLGLQAAPAPVFGAAVQSWAGLVFLILLAPLIPTGERFRWERAALPYFLLGGLFVTLSLYFYFRALETGDITVVTPIAHTWPLLVVFLSRGFLQRIEHITPRAMLSTVFVVGGGFMVMS